MKNLQKNSILFMLTLFCSFFLFTEKVSAADYYYQDWGYSLQDDGTAELTDYYGSDVNITIPTTVNSITVSTLGYDLFYYNNSIESVNVPASVTKVDSYALYGGDNLKTVTFHNKDVEISYSAFSSYYTGVIRCYKYSTAYYYAIQKGFTVSLLDPYISYSKQSVVLNCNQQLALPATKHNFTAGTITYNSSNPNVATINASGTITGKTPGTAKITASVTVNGQVLQATCNVTVSTPTISLNQSKATVKLKKTATLSVVRKNFTGGTVSFTSSNKQIATVNNSGVVTGVAPGTAKITATITVNGIKLQATCNVTVPKPSISLNKSKATLKIKKTLNLSVTRKNFTGGTVTYKSSKTNVATVSKNGVVTGKNPGTTKITATVKVHGLTLTSTCNVTVSKPTLNYTSYCLWVKEGVTLKPQNSSGKVTWKSSNTKVATVDSKGRVVGKKKGNATITCKVNGVTLTSKIKVVNPSLSHSSMTLTKHFSDTIYIYGHSQKGTFKSSNTKVATVNSKGKVTAKGNGKATITVVTDGVTLKCKVTVVSNSVTLDGTTSLDDVSMGKFTVTGQKLYFDGKKLKLNATVLNRTYYKFSKLNYLTVEVYSNGNRVINKTFYNQKLNLKSYSKKKLTLTLADSNLYKTLDLRNCYIRTYYSYNYYGNYEVD